jgi:phage regulator Rha-like protein
LTTTDLKEFLISIGRLPNDKGLTKKDNLTNQVLNLHQSGSSLREIAAEVGINHMKVKRILDKIKKQIMNELAKITSEEGFISSRQIAETIGKRHADVIRDIRILIEKSAIDLIINLNANLRSIQDEPICFESVNKTL